MSDSARQRWVDRFEDELASHGDYALACEAADRAAESDVKRRRESVAAECPVKLLHGPRHNTVVDESQFDAGLLRILAPPSEVLAERALAAGGGFPALRLPRVALYRLRRAGDRTAPFVGFVRA